VLAGVNLTKLPLITSHITSISAVCFALSRHRHLQALETVTIILIFSQIISSLSMEMFTFQRDFPITRSNFSLPPPKITLNCFVGTIENHSASREIDE
jgi:hypothetical protein